MRVREVAPQLRAGQKEDLRSASAGLKRYALFDELVFYSVMSDGSVARHAELRKLWTEALEGVGIATPRKE